MEYRIEKIAAKNLVGKRMKMSFVNNTTAALWKSFMPERKAIHNSTSKYLYSLQVYPSLFFDNFNPQTEFEKWALVEVDDLTHIPAGMEAFVLPAGLYAVFYYKGAASEGAKLFQYILQTWLPASAYMLDNRPHFELLGEKYKKNAADSEEEIWIPIQPKP